jgi:hypothetical protein
MYEPALPQLIGYDQIIGLFETELSGITILLTVFLNTNGCATPFMARSLVRDDMELVVLPI